MSRAGLVVVAALLLAGCRFAPTVDGSSITGCTADVDCPMCGSCVEGVCVPVPPAVGAFGLQAESPVVEAGDLCHLVVTDVDPTCDSTYVWRQISGADVDLSSHVGSEQSFSTVPDYVGAYLFEVSVGNGEAMRAARGSCTALVTSDAAWIVAGASGSCAQDDPCGSFSAAEDTQTGRLPRRVYLGVADADGTPVVIAPELPDAAGNIILGDSVGPLEIHGGFVYPDWRRDLDLAPTRLSGASNEMLQVSCNDCILSGLSELHAPSIDGSINSPWAVHINGENVALRQSRVELAGPIVAGSVVGLDVNGRDVVLDEVRVVAYGDFGDAQIVGVHAFSGTGFVANRLDVDLTAASAWVHQGVVLRQGGVIDRLHIATGPAAGWVDGLFVECGPASVSNALLDLRTGRPGDSYSLSVGADGTCAAPRVFRSILALGGSGDRATGLYLGIPAGVGGFLLEDSILDAGAAFQRYSVAASSSYLAEANSIASTVLIYDPVGASSDASGITGRSPDAGFIFAPEADEASVLGCDGCLTVVDSLPFVDADAADFHLPPDADCCVGQASVLAPGEPTRDLDNRPRPTAPLRPTIGPYEPRPESGG